MRHTYADDPPRRGKPYLWVSWITKLLAGEASCEWAPWYKARFRFAKKTDNSFDMAAWSADHRALLERRRDELLAAGWTVTVEDQNAIRMEGQSVTLAGKPDIVARKDDGALLSDAKTGQQRGSDWWQLLCYMLALGRTTEGRRYEGEVVYPGGIVPVPASDFDDARRAEIVRVIRLVGHDHPPARVPSPRECAYCDILACPDRVEQDVLVVQAEEF